MKSINKRKNWEFTAWILSALVRFMHILGTRAGMYDEIAEISYSYPSLSEAMFEEFYK